MEWQDEAIVISARAYGESGMILSVFTRQWGRHKGLLRGGAGRRLRAGIQPGAIVAASWRARLADQLGTLTIEPVRVISAAVLADPMRLAAVTSCCAMVEATLPEREAYGEIFDGAGNLLADIEGRREWPMTYVAWEVALLSALGFGLQLDHCAVSGRTNGLTHVSPRTGRAVAAEFAEAYLPRLLTLPRFLCGGDDFTWRDIAAGLRLTEHFLVRCVFAELATPIPGARSNFLERVHARVQADGSEPHLRTS